MYQIQIPEPHKKLYQALPGKCFDIKGITSKFLINSYRESENDRIASNPDFVPMDVETGPIPEIASATHDQKIEPAKSRWDKKHRPEEEQLTERVVKRRLSDDNTVRANMQCCYFKEVGQQICKDTRSKYQKGPKNNIYKSEQASRWRE